jgi:hypothetical protein
MRASKKGEVLLMRKLDKLNTHLTEDPGAQVADAATATWALSRFSLDLGRLTRTISMLSATSFRRHVLSLTRTL